MATAHGQYTCGEAPHEPAAGGTPAASSARIGTVMERTSDSIRAALSSIDRHSDDALEFGRVAAELRHGVAVIIGGQVGAGVKGRIGAKLNAGPPLTKTLTVVVADELETFAATQRAVASTTDAAIPFGENVTAYRALTAATDTAAGQANHADTLLRHLRPTLRGRLLAAALPHRRRYRATAAETAVTRQVLETLAHRHRDAAADATDALRPHLVSRQRQ